MKKLCFSIFLLVMLVLAGCASVGKISLDDVQSITVFETGKADGDFYLCTGEQVQSFVKAYNRARLYTNDAGTTHPYRADVAFQDGTTMRVWGGTQGFCTMESETTGQQNIKGRRLDEWFSGFASDN